MHGIEKRIVYIIRSVTRPEHHYVGLTSDVRARVDWHNHGPGGFTRACRPWALVVVVEFASAANAGRFERYLKSGSGRAFARRHFGDAIPRVAPPIDETL